MATADQTQIDMPGNVATEDLDRPDLIAVTGDTLDSPIVKEYARDLAFMEDELTISISQTTDKNAENPVPCGCNGEVKWLRRGELYKIKRKFVDSLIKVEDAVETQQYKDKDGVDQTRVIRTPALKYPVNVHNDPAGELGRRWFEHQCKHAW